MVESQPWPHLVPDEMALLQQDREVSHASNSRSKTDALDCGRIVRYTITDGTEVLDVAKNLVAGRVRIESGSTLVLDAFHPEIQCSTISSYSVAYGFSLLIFWLSRVGQVKHGQ